MNRQHFDEMFDEMISEARRCGSVQEGVARVILRNVVVKPMINTLLANQKQQGRTDPRRFRRQMRRMFGKTACHAR